ncbi:carboxypeptidase-like regulatory domain-containing protein [Halalkalibaculum sp. DA384]|uniref:TonB-dependent receptor n=1 Tax=Halalkalibaculum sp. DA384 TaxID=3373606 RepID=UPI003754B78B
MIQLRVLFLCLLTATHFSLPLAEGVAQSASGQRPLPEILRQIQEETGFRFLYREALVSGIHLDFSTKPSPSFEELRQVLQPHNLEIRVDSAYNQVIIIKQEPSAPGQESKSITISGQVVDAATGERLPFATITWQQEGQTRGKSANSSGRFQLNYPSGGSKLELTSSYVGYLPETVRLDLSARSLEEVTFRLDPQRIDGNELVVTGTSYYGQLDQNESGLVDIGTFSPLGSSNSVRALQVLPSTSLSPALSGDMHIRGSPADGFHLLIDGLTVFNQSHLFGLLDSFNADVLQRSAFYYDIAPAQYPAPPGGTLSMVTQTGSLNNFSASVGASNTSYRLTMEGPLRKGNSSWMVSGRSSYLNAVDWLNNSKLVQWGLNVNRSREILDENLVNIETRLVQPGKTDAHFFDLHGKLYVENQDGSRLIFSGYFGGDRTSQEAERLYRTFRSASQNIEFRDVATTNDWSNGTSSVQYQDQLSESLYIHSTAGFSIYQSEFSKDDFSYTRINQDNDTFQLFTFPFENRSILNELKAEQQLDLHFEPWQLTAGISYHYYLGEYFEDSFNRPGFFTSMKSHKIDLYAQLDYTGIDWADISGGTRLHYYSNGEYLRWSPRLKLRLFPQSAVSVGGGYSRNFQFLNKISLSNTVTSDIWIMANSDQPPTGVEYYSAGLYLEPNHWLNAQIEGYYKQFDHVRLHEINALSLTNTFNNAPWYIDNSGKGQGVEFLAKANSGQWGITQTFTISEMLLSNPVINDGDPFFADWDRTYRYGITLDGKLTPGVFLYLSWMYASGVPNRLATFGAANAQRLDHYQRTDVTLEYKRSLSFGELNGSLSIFNLFDRSNTWYRELAFVLDREAAQNRFRTVPVDVYDIGFQPSFNLSLSF